MTAPMPIQAARIARDRAPASPRRMGAMLTGGAAVLAVVLATALPARAAPDAEDYLKTLLGLAIIGAIAESADKGDGRRHDTYKPAPPAKKKGKLIPAGCAVQVSHKRRTSIVYTENCLRRAGVTRDLPYQCSSEAKIRGRWDRVFSTECLRSAGFRIGKH